ncbi:MAG: aminoacyl-histidine dipeptidase [Erysipelotrichaceae bacterium]|nr:aminoacyl-histidine dipeptidase [Erysipelotrichaceae bacterium]
MEFDLNKRHCFWFNELAMIPRGSGNEKAASDFIVKFAQDHGLAYKQDHVWNVIVDKPASPGYENAEPLIMQAHLDVVCEKNKDVEHDFTKDPLDLYVDEEGWLHARGTTLGCDDGFGVSYMLSILEDDTLPHPPLSCMFTTMEEIGLLGARELKKEDIHGKRLINLDSGGETKTSVSSAGGCTSIVSRALEFEENSDPAYFLGIRGLLGGHSGGLIHTERGNSNTLAARVLKELQLAGLDVRLVSFNGGLKFNAIPREADVIFTSASAPDALEAQIRKTEKNIQSELEFSDAGFKVLFEAHEAAAKKLTKTVSDEVLNFLFLMINGFRHRSMAIEGLTAASLNMGTVTTTEDKIVIEDLMRSALDSHMDEMIDQIRVLADLLHMDTEFKDRFPGWAYARESPLREIARQVEKAHGNELQENASHGGLECSIFKGLVPELDIITFGPIASGAHTPDEKLDLASFDRTFEMLKEIVSACR